jgi:hypothetical protein
MTSTRRRRAVILLAAVCGGCLLPSDHSPRLTVDVDTLPRLLLPGDTVLVQARLLDAAGRPLPNAGFVFNSDNAKALEVAARDSRSALLLVRDTGQATVLVSAEGFPAVPAAERLVEVRPRLQIDSIRPLVARYGETVTIYGVGLDPAAHPEVRGGSRNLAAHHFTPADPARPWRVGRLAVYVTAGMPLRGPIAVRSDRGAVTSRDTLVVTPEDVYEPNSESAPADLGTLTSDLVNPALAFERSVPGDNRETVDAYRFTTADHNAWTVRIAGLSGAEYVAVADTTVSGKPVTTFEYLHAFAWSKCGGTAQRQFAEAKIYFPRSDTLRVPRIRTPNELRIWLDYAPDDSLNVQDRPYYFSISRGYSSDLQADASEPNDWCQVATPVTLSGQPMALSIDRPMDFDWFRFEVAGTGANVTMDLQFDTPNDLDLLLFRDLLPDSVSQPIGRAESSSQTHETASNALPPGKYFAVVYSWLARPGGYHATFSASTLPAPPALPSAAPEPAAKRRAAGREPPYPTPAGARR